ncbi:uncharacterized protein LOC119735074 [Patiria miniata]|uniref:Farnesoic acid O-methyl transferase domain-containing protein n=1 Tax=Patiria miniata TaxID=46514 RepID=A0A914AMN5_PATMI|nr:uncharacterized protein LOC119735074 [Patiria miniata]
MGEYVSTNRGQIRLVWIICGLLSGVEAQCYVGCEPDSSGHAAWVMPTQDPCVCRGQALRLGGINIATARSVTPTYYNLSEIANAADSGPVLTGLASCPDEDTGDGKLHCHTFEDSTGGEYRYEFAKLPKSEDGKFLVKFSVRSKNDVHISLSSQNNDVADMYEIVIGGPNGVSAIRRCSQCRDLASEFESSGWLDKSEFKHFWVGATPGTKGRGGSDVLTIALGKDSEVEAIVSYEDSSPLPVEYLGFKQGTDTSVASYRFCGLN